MPCSQADQIPWHHCSAALFHNCWHISSLPVTNISKVCESSKFSMWQR